MASLGSILRVNAISCLTGGAVLLIAPHAVTALLGDPPKLPLVWIGGALLLNGAHLLFASFRRKAVPVEIIWFSVGDLSWWLATIALVSSGVWITTVSGTVIALAVAAIVASLGVAQLACLGAARTGQSWGEHWRSIGRSWLALPNLVKAWLFALNVIFLLSPAFLTWPKAAVILLAYAATGPLLLGFAAVRGGLTRDMGVGHLIPWLPLFAWLAVDIRQSEMGGMVMVYILVLALVTAACLLMDVYDLGRWLWGERQVLGMSNAEDPARGRVSG